MSMTTYRCYSCRPTEQVADNDSILRDKFFSWRYGEYERRAENFWIRENGYHPHNRTPREIWEKAEEFLRLATGEDAKRFFSNIANKYKNKTLFGI